MKKRLLYLFTVMLGLAALSLCFKVAWYWGCHWYRERVVLGEREAVNKAVAQAEKGGALETALVEAVDDLLARRGLCASLEVLSGVQARINSKEYYLILVSIGELFEKALKEGCEESIVRTLDEHSNDADVIECFLRAAYYGEKYMVAKQRLQRRVRECMRSHLPSVICQAAGVLAVLENDADVELIADVFLSKAVDRSDFELLECLLVELCVFEERAYGALRRVREVAMRLQKPRASELRTLIEKVVYSRIGANYSVVFPGAATPQED